jgi:hypothetical protein
MLRNHETQDWMRPFKKTLRDQNKCWTDKQHKGAIWTRKNDVIQTINANKLKGKVEIVEFELTELISDRK